MDRKCFLCGSDASSKEHVPPKCFFPDGGKYRTQLITVPSCTKHNLDTSQDDEYVRNVIAMSIGNNAIGFKQFFEKVVKSYIQSPRLMNRTLARSQRVITAQGSTTAFEIERDRFDSVIKKIAYGLYYDKFRKPWNRKLIVMSRHLRCGDMSEDEFGELLRWAENNCPPLQFHGENSKVFQYIFDPDDQDPEYSFFWIRFYENFDAWIIAKQGSTTFDL